jgi:hypothetical protein
MYARNATEAGTDCTALSNTDAVSCQRGICQIDSCRPGFTLSADGVECEAVPSNLGAVRNHGAWSGFAIQKRRS